MKRLQAFKFQLKLSEQQERDLRRFSGACRYVFNRALALQSENYRAGNKFIPYVKMATWLVEWKLEPETQWLKDVPSQPLQHALKHLESAYKNFFQKRAAHPRFKKRGVSDSFRYPQGIKVEQVNNRIYLPKLGWVSYRNSRKIIGLVKNVTVTHANGKWYVSIQTEYNMNTDETHPSSTVAGLDIAEKKVIVSSDGTVYQSTDNLKALYNRLSKYQRQLKRKDHLSANWKKQNLKIQRLYQRIDNIRNDYLHKVTTAISKKYSIVIIENLRSPHFGGARQNGYVSAYKANSNPCMLDRGWNKIRHQLEYKQRWLSGKILVVSLKECNECSCCSLPVLDSCILQNKFVCNGCGYTASMSINRACNILSAGHAAIACGGFIQLSYPLKQEPSEAN
ncbi:transposase [Providencia rettgeri]